jgi:hypothetical protein
MLKSNAKSDSNFMENTKTKSPNKPIPMLAKPSKYQSNDLMFPASCHLPVHCLKRGSMSSTKAKTKTFSKKTLLMIPTTKDKKNKGKATFRSLLKMRAVPSLKRASKRKAKFPSDPLKSSKSLCWIMK